jgi:tetratricopeptide (TPR) repeat protein
MKKSQSHGVLLGAAAAAVFSFGIARHAAAQYQAAGQDGHALDANNRVGSGGFNGPRQGGGNGVTSDNIVNKQVTGLSGFTGPIHERDARAFSGPIPQGVDSIVRQSSGPGGAAGYSNGYGKAQPYYGSSRFVAPPGGSLPLGSTGSYIGTTVTTPSSLANGLDTQSQLATGLQARSQSAGTLLLNAMMNPSAYGNINSAVNSDATLQAAQLYGQHTTMAPGDNNVLGTEFNSQFGGINNPEILRMRDELLQAAGPGNLNSPQNLNGAKPAPTENGQPITPSGLNQPLNQPQNVPFDTPVNSPLNATLNSSQIANDPLASTGIVPAKPSLVPANQQSSLLDTLQQRLARSTDVGKAMADAQANAPQKSTNGVPTPRLPQTNPPGVPEGPVKVQDLATGVKAKGLHDLISGGESLTTDGKYDMAIEKFNDAIRVAPNNPLPFLGRANAELAGGYYAKADQDLRLVFRSNRELLLAQFDLKALFPKDREEYVRKDLKDLAAADVKSVRPWFLLAYLDYNTNRPASADEALDEAAKRAGSSDPSIRLLKQHWTLPSNRHAVPTVTKPVAPPAP